MPNLTKLPYIKDVVKGHINGDSDLLDVYKSSWDLDDLDNLLEKHPYTKGQRKVLVDVLKEQYEGLELSDDDLIIKNIELLKQPNTFTITTGQQIHPFLGPLYVLYKIGSAINLAKKLNTENPELNFIPVFWMATEDHDFEEIQTIKLFGKEYKWECEHGGVVGKLDCGTLAPLLAQMENDFADLKENELFQKAKQYYKKGINLADATRMITNDMFENTGLICLDADNKALKKLFVKEMMTEISSDRNHQLMNKNSRELKKYIKKTPINSNRTNLFCLGKSTRNRIDKKEEVFFIKGTNKTFNLSEILEDVLSSPQSYSPNVSFRPLYQEKILPNIAYIAGPTEYIYWMQLGKIFESSRLATPMLLHRNSVFITNNGITKKLDKIGLKIEDFFGNDVEELELQLKRRVIQDFDMSEIIKNIDENIDFFKDKWFDLDSETAKKNLNALKSVSKTMKNLEKEYQKTVKNSPIMVNQLTYIEKILELTVKGGIQERNMSIFQQIVNNKNLVKTYIKTSDSQCFNTFVVLGV